ncbi:MAG: hypothetical protein ACK443_09440, partial [Methylococcaceae bacterium]
MNKPIQEISTVVSLLRDLYPPNVLVHIGVGQGVGDMSAWRQWSVARAVLVDTQAEPVWFGQEQLAHPDWRWISQAVSDHDGDALYYIASNAAENGLLDPDSLSHYWPNLQAVESHSRAVYRLDSLLLAGDMVETPDWLIIDCLPSLTILKGARQSLETCSVVWVRAILEPQQDNVNDAGLASIRDYLEARGFDCLGVAEALNPGLGTAIFVKNWRGCAQQTITQSIEQTTTLAAIEKEKAEALARVGTLEQEKNDAFATRDALAQEKNSLIAARDAEVQAKAEAHARIGVLEQEKNDALAARDALTQEKNSLIAARDAEAQAKAEAHARIGTLEQENNDAFAARDALAQEKNSLIAARDAEAQAKAEAHARIGALEQERNDALAARDALAQEKNSLIAARDAEAQAKAEAHARVGT